MQAESKHAGLVPIPHKASDGVPEDDMLMDAGAHDLIEAVHAKDHARVKDAIRAMHAACYGAMVPKE